MLRSTPSCRRACPPPSSPRHARPLSAPRLASPHTPRPQAFGAQAFILVFHLTGPELDIRLHTLLALATLAVAASVAAAGAFPASSLACYARVVSLLNLGSFWIQTGLLMYNRPAFDTPEGVAMAPIIFVLHLFGWAVALLAAMAAAAVFRQTDKLHAHAHADAEHTLKVDRVPLLAGLSNPTARKSSPEAD